LQAIAEQLGVSSKTVSNGQTQIKLKLGIESKQQIRHMAKTHGLMIEKSL
jgi:DNA-binding CsgD family transcriptional regulator